MLDELYENGSVPDLTFGLVYSWRLVHEFEVNCSFNSSASLIKQSYIVANVLGVTKCYPVKTKWEGDYFICTEKSGYSSQTSSAQIDMLSPAIS